MRGYIDLIEHNLIEMVVRSNPKVPAWVVAHRDSIWLLTGNDDESDAAALADIEERTGVDAATIYSLQDEVEERPDILMASIYRHTLHVGGHMQMNPLTSLLIKKVCRQLNMEFSHTAIDNNGDEDEVTLGHEEMLGRLPNMAFHGTTSKHLHSLLRFDLKPDQPHHNWRKVGHFADRVFLTASRNNAMFHAANASSQQGGFGIVLAMNIPDPAKIDMDYDTAVTYYGDHHELHSRPEYHNSASKEVYALPNSRGGEIQQHSVGTDFTRETGIFAYKGRIPASQFRFFIVPNSTDDALTPENSSEIDTADELRRAVEMLSDYGEYDPDMSFDDDEEEWDDEDQSPE